MEKQYQYKTFGTCSAQIFFEIVDAVAADGAPVKILRNVSFVGGCNGNLQGIARLVEGMPVQEVIRRLDGISCNGGPTSCPDQLSRAIKAALAQQ